MKKTFSFIGILLAIAGFLYAGVHIFGTTSKYMEYNSLKSNVKKLSEERIKKMLNLLRLLKKMQK